MRPQPGAALSALLLGGLLACAAPAPTEEPPAGDMPTAGAASPPVLMTSPSAEVFAAAAQLRERLEAAGFRLDESPVEYRPAEPASVQDVSRAVYRVSLAEPRSGWVVIYDLGRADRAVAAGQAYAAYLASGPGRTNFPADAQFTLNQLGGALVFSWWSATRAADAERAEAAFEAIRSIGQSIEVAP